MEAFKMQTLVEKPRPFQGERKDDPFKEIYSLWNDITDGAKVGIPHVVGRAEISEDGMKWVDLQVTVYTEESPLVFREQDDVYFVVPVRPDGGVEEVYLRIHRTVSDTK